MKEQGKGILDGAQKICRVVCPHGHDVGRGGGRVTSIPPYAAIESSSMAAQLIAGQPGDARARPRLGAGRGEE